MIATERAMYIIDKLNQHGVISLKALSKDLHISESTIRRDIEKLEQQGKLTRVLGGATAAFGDIAELTMQQKGTLHSSEKEQVAAYATQFVNDGDCVYVDGGTSMNPLLEMLSMKNIQIVTNNHMAIKSFVAPKAHIFLIGGKYLPHFQMTVGPIAETNMQGFHFDHAFIGCTGVDLEQRISYTSEIETLNIKKIALRHCLHSYLLFDSSKIHVKSFCKLMSLDDFEYLICNAIKEQYGEIPNMLIAGVHKTPK